MDAAHAAHAAEDYRDLAGINRVAQAVAELPVHLLAEGDGAEALARTPRLERREPKLRLDLVPSSDEVRASGRHAW